MPTVFRCAYPKRTTYTANQSSLSVARMLAIAHLVPIETFAKASIVDCIVAYSIHTVAHTDVKEIPTVRRAASMAHIPSALPVTLSKQTCPSPRCQHGH